MLITDRDEIIRLKLIHGEIRGTLNEFAETYAVKGDYSVQTNTFVLIHDRGTEWSIRHIEQDGLSMMNEWGGYGGGRVGQEKYIKTKWREILFITRPRWQETRCKELRGLKGLMTKST